MPRLTTAERQALELRIAQLAQGLVDDGIIKRPQTAGIIAAASAALQLYLSFRR